MIIAHISDAHLVANGEKTMGVAPMVDNLVATVAHINQISPPPDVVLLTGDVTDTGQFQAVKTAHEILDALKCPVFVIPGNHDDLTTFSQGFEPYKDYVVEDFPIRLIGMDSTVPGVSGGELTPAQLTWLDTTLAEDTTRPTIIFMHHPPVKCSVLETDKDGFIGADALGEIVRKYDNIERILCGHIHLAVHAHWQGTVISTAPSLGMQLALDLTMQQPSAFYKTPPAFLLHHWTPQEYLISHVITVQKMDGPYAF